MMSVAEPEVSPLWVVGSRDLAAERQLVRELRVTPLVAAVLVQRGFGDPQAAFAFLNPSLDDLHDPKKLPDYEAARNEILGAKERGELIYVHGDYDVDGVTSAAIFQRFLSRIGCKVHTHVPHRMKEGYGIHVDAVEEAISMGAKLFLTCDCGSGALAQIERAKQAGMKVVVTDHHSVGEELPKSDAFINPHRPGSDYPFDELSGAGVVFKLCQGLTEELGHPVGAYHRAFLDLAALGTVADVMPLLGENRIIARFGIERLQDTKKVGLQALMRESKVGLDPTKPIKARHIGWQLGPRLNAVGRLEDAAVALQLLIESDSAKAVQLAARLEAVNVERRAQTAAIVEQAEEMVLSSGYDRRSLMVVANEGWHSGIVGIVAGRLVEKFNRPCFVLTVNPETGMCKGSARGIPNFHLAAAIRAHPELLEGGGHAMAAGCSFPVDRLEAVRSALDTYAQERLKPEDLAPKVVADMEVTWDEVTLSAAEEMASLEPFGCENPEPVFVARSVALSQIRPTKNPSHVRLVLRQGGGKAFPGIAFNIGEALSALGAGTEVDLLFKAEVNEFQGFRELQWQVRDFRKN